MQKLYCDTLSTIRVNTGLGAAYIEALVMATPGIVRKAMKDCMETR